MNAAERNRYRKLDICFVCLKPILSSDPAVGVGYFYSLRCHFQRCAGVLQSMDRDYSDSPKGRFRTRREISEALAAWRLREEGR